MILGWALTSPAAQAAMPPGIPLWVWVLTGLVQGGAVAVLVWVVRRIIQGDLVPRSTLVDAQTERDRWAEVAKGAVTQNGQLLVGAQVAAKVTQAALPEESAG